MPSNWENPRTIVRYTAAEPPFNGYPDRIVSPPRSSSCCLEEMAPLGNLHRDDELPYMYRQCRVCGHTVRHFLEDVVAHIPEFRDF